MPSRIPLRGLAAAFALAIAVRVVYVLVARPDPMAMVDSVEYDLMARDLLAGAGFVDRVGFVRPPLYPLFVAASYALGGMLVLQLLQLALSAATAPLIGLLAAALSRRPGAATPAAVVAAVYPWFFQWFWGLASEPLFTALTVGTLVLATTAASSRSFRTTALAGITFGLAALTRSNILILAPFLGLWLARLAGLRSASVLTLAVIAGLAPFAAVNLAEGNGLVLGSSGGGLNFYIGNNEDTARLYSGTLSDNEWRALSARSVLGERALAFAGCKADQGPAACTAHLPASERDAFWYRAGFRYIAERPIEWIGTELAKVAHYWRPWVEPRAYSLPVVVVSGASFLALLVVAGIGLVCMPRVSAVLVVLVAVAGTIAAVGWNVQLRYRYALVDPVLLAAAGAPLASLFEWYRRR